MDRESDRERREREREREKEREGRLIPANFERMTHLLCGRVEEDTIREPMNTLSRGITGRKRKKERKRKRFQTPCYTT